MSLELRFGGFVGEFGDDFIEDSFAGLVAVYTYEKSKVAIMLDDG